MAAVSGALALGALGLTTGTANAFNPQPDPPGKHLSDFNPQPEPPGLHVSADFNPQPEPPGLHH